ncbi:MAG: hypothetical protein ACLRZ6_02305 [Lachnospiraceae bacterium]
MLDAVLLDKGEVAYGPLQRNKYNNENVEHYDYNLEKSAEFLKQQDAHKMQMATGAETGRELALQLTRHRVIRCALIWRRLQHSSFARQDLM